MDRHISVRFSIVIPCYNEEAYIGETLASLKRQDFAGKFEVIVVDNNCTDQTVRIAKSFGARIVKEKNAGVCWARQAGTAAAKGDIIVSTDADTLFSINWLSEIDAQFKASDNIVAVGGGCRFVDAPGWVVVYPVLLFGYSHLVYKLTSYIPYITATNTAFKKSAWSGYNTTMTQGGDELGLLHTLVKRGKVVFTNKYVVYTSPRRLTKGFLHGFFITFLYYYILAFYLNKWFKRPIIGGAPAYRSRAQALRQRYGVIVLALLFTSVLMLKMHHKAYATASHLYHKVRNIKKIDL